MWKICGYELKAGEKKQVMLHPFGMEYEMPATLVCGAKEGKTLLVTAQMHAGEYNGSAAVMQLANEIEPAELKGNLILIHCINTSGFWQQKHRVIPEDHTNLNADYPGDEHGTTGKKIAAWFVKEVFPHIDFIADLHGGGENEILYPCLFFPRAEAVTEEALAAAQALNTEYLIASSNSCGEIGYAAFHMGIPGLLLERGYGCFLKDEWIQGHKQSIELLMDHLGMCPLKYELIRVEQKVYRNAEYLEADQKGVWLPAITENQKVVKGELLGTLTDFFGNVKKTYHAIADGTVIYYTAGMSVVDGDALVAYGLD